MTYLLFFGGKEYCWLGRQLESGKSGMKVGAWVKVTHFFFPSGSAGTPAGGLLRRDTESLESSLML